MSTVILGSTSVRSNERVLNVAIWTAQTLLFVVFGFVGLMKLTQPMGTVAATMPFLAIVPPDLIRFTGAAELMGALGVVLPSVTRIQTWLTPAAGIGLALVMILATAFHGLRGEFGTMAVPMVLGVLAAVVVWGRGHRLVIAVER